MMTCSNDVQHSLSRFVGWWHQPTAADRPTERYVRARRMSAENTSPPGRIAGAIRRAPGAVTVPGTTVTASHGPPLCQLITSRAEVRARCT